MVEFAILFPLLLSLLAGFIELGMALQQYHLVQKSLRDAARHLAQLPGYDAVTPFDATPCNAVPTGDVLSVKNLAIYGNVSGTGTAKLDGWGYDDICVNGPTSQTVTFNGVTTDVLVLELTTVAPFNDFGLVSLLGFNNFTLQGSHEQPYLPV